MSAKIYYHIQILPKIVCLQVDTNSGESYTFRHAERRIEAIARRMYRDGFRSGDRLALCCTNCVEYPMFIAATLRLNGTVVGINHMLTKGTYVEEINRVNVTECTDVNDVNKINYKKVLSCIAFSCIAL